MKPLNIGPQPPAEKINWLNLFYAAEWVVFAGFALFIWWRLVKDDYRRGPRGRPRRGAGSRGTQPVPDPDPTEPHPTETKVQS